MRELGNVIWIFFGGWILSLLSFIVGIILSLLVFTAPIGLGLIQYSKFCLFPFTSQMVSKTKFDVQQNIIWRTYSGLIMILYVLFVGIWAFLLTIPIIFLNFVMIISIPAAMAMSKSLGTIFNPVGKICVSREVGEELKRRKAVKTVDNLLH